MIKYLNGTFKENLVPLTENIHVIKWYVEASLAIHRDFKSHTEGVMTLGGGTRQPIPCKKNLNTQSIA